MKECLRCKRVLLCEKFYERKDGNLSDGCIECWEARKRKRAERRKYCKDCGSRLSVVSGRGRPAERCVSCRKKRREEWESRKRQNDVSV
jgi:hypothetical protein